MNRSGRLALTLVSVLTLAACKNKGQDTSAPDEIELPPETKIDKDDPAADILAASEPGDEKVAAKKVTEPATQEVVHPQDRDPDQEKAKMKQSRTMSAKAKKLLREGKGDQAIAEARKALREHEQNVEAMLVIAEAFYKQGKHELVQSVTGSILKVDEKVLTPEEKSQAYNLMGFAYLQAGNRGKAFRAFKDAAETDDQNAAAWNNLGVQYMWQGDTATAEACFEYAVSLDDKFAESHLNHGAALRANNKTDEAEAAFRAASRLRPDWAEVHFNLGVLYLDADKIGTLDTIARLEAAITEFNNYKAAAAKGNTTVERSAKKRGPTDAMGNELVSVAQADLYIKAANKAIESEERRIERDKKRKERDEKQAAEDEAEAAEADKAAEEPPPTQDPEPQKPGEQPAEPPAEPPPAEQPSQPPAEQPSEPPAEQPPADPPPQEKPAPQKPNPQKPAPQQPKPQKPSPQKPG